jgi:hypothetical protein
MPVTCPNDTQLAALARLGQGEQHGFGRVVWCSPFGAKRDSSLARTGRRETMRETETGELETKLFIGKHRWHNHAIAPLPVQNPDNYDARDDFGGHPDGLEPGATSR